MLTVRTTALSLIIAACVGSQATAADTKPLLMEGKQTLFQRVLIKPDSQLQKTTASGSEKSEAIPFSVLYVYDRVTVGDEQWVQVGADIHGSIQGWLPESRTITWNQGLTVAFKDTDDSSRVMLFKNKDSLKSAVEEQSLKTYKSLYKDASKGKRDKDSPVVALAPASLGDLKDNFYLVPILDHEDIWLGNHRATLLNVASLPLNPKPTVDTQESEPEAVVPQTPLNTLKTGVMFVIDSTMSMGPYIDRTREAVRKIQADLTRNTSGDNLHFGLVAFRDNNTPAPGLAYVAETVAPLSATSTAQDFLKQVGNVKAATVSSQDFSEDAYAGLKKAIDDVDWNAFKARYIILITDAGAREGDDPLSSTGLSTTELQKAAADRKIATTVLHLRTPLGVEYHAAAQTQYEELSNFPGIGSLYYGVDTGNVGQFGRALDTLTKQIRDQVVIETETQTAEIEAEEKEDSKLSALQEKIAKVGYALQMQYLKNDDNDQVPEIIDAWIVDKNVASPKDQAIEIRVLLTRDQLSELHDVMRQVLDSFEEGVLSPSNFFEDLKSVAANLSRDPEQLNNSTGDKNLASMGLIGEYIDDLPYQSPAMAVSGNEWELWSPEQQINFTHELEEKIAYYKALYEHPALWTTPGSDTINGSSVITLPLSLMP